MKTVRRSGGRAVGIIVLVLSACPAVRLSAQQDPIVAQLTQAQQLERRGRREDARRIYSGLIDSYNRGGRFTAPQLTAMGTAAERLSTWDPEFARDALRLYDQAASRDRNDPEPKLRAARLLLARYNGAEAGDAYAEILRRWPRNARGLLGIAEVRKFLGEGDPVAAAESSLAADSTLVESHVFLARLRLETDDHLGAARALARALELNPASREALAVRAAHAWLRSQQNAFDAVDRQITAEDPRYAMHLVTTADAMARARRYHDAVAMTERAVARDSTAWRGWALLGVNRMRIGDIAGGRRALEVALRGDPFDLWTKNSLDLLDQLERFPSTTSPRFRFVMDGRESALLSLYFAPLAEEAFTALEARYRVRPQVPIRIEVFPRHADFSVRVFGLPGIGALGVCFGPVIAMDSPSSRDRGQFSWGSTLWHEIAHSFHMTLSDYRVPRWLTEGLAVLEERRSGKAGFGDDVGPEFLSAWAGDSLPKLSRLNEGFIRPTSGVMLSHAYLLSSLAAEYLESVHGADVSSRMLRAYGQGQDTRGVIRTVLDTEPDTLDTRFDAWMRQRYARQLADLRGFAASLPSRARARALLERGDTAGALLELTALTREDESAYDANVELAALLERRGAHDAALAALERALYISPFDPVLHERLAAHYARNGRHDALVRERRAVIALNPTDRAGAWYRLATAQVGGGWLEDARRSVLRALEVAPGYADAQDLLLRLSEGGRP